jgi:hypothetical protein
VIGERLDDAGAGAFDQGADCFEIGDDHRRARAGSAAATRGARRRRGEIAAVTCGARSMA